MILLPKYNIFTGARAIKNHVGADFCPCPLLGRRGERSSLIRNPFPFVLHEKERERAGDEGKQRAMGGVVRRESVVRRFCSSRLSFGGSS